jgi:rare lipoprotein A (RlpA)-like double-psi beta-barrel protein
LKTEIAFMDDAVFDRRWPCAVQASRTCAGANPGGVSQLSNVRSLEIPSTASGEVTSMTRLTAAHSTLPFGTNVLVTNVGDGKTVVVRITDRGPYRRGCIIDVSRAAARELDMDDNGTTLVSSAWCVNRAATLKSEAGSPPRHLISSAIFSV